MHIEDNNGQNNDNRNNDQAQPATGSEQPTTSNDQPAAEEAPSQDEPAPGLDADQVAAESAETGSVAPIDQSQEQPKAASGDEQPETESADQSPPSGGSGEAEPAADASEAGPADGDTKDSDAPSGEAPVAEEAAAAPATSGDAQGDTPAEATIEVKINGVVSGTAVVPVGTTVKDAFAKAGVEITNKQVRNADNKVMTQSDKLTGAGTVVLTTTQRASGG